MDSVNDYAPDEITEDYIEIVCGDLQCAIGNVFNNDGDDEEEYDKAITLLSHISRMLDDICDQ